MSPTATLSLTLTTFGAPPGDGWRTVLDLARRAEDAGVDRIIVTDHVVMGRNTQEYSWGKFPVSPDAPWMEPLTMLTAIAAVTERVRLATGILIIPLRPAPLLAKTVATLDVLSGGRVDLGVGTGWQREEYDASGLDFAERGRLLTDTMAACRSLWDQTPATYSNQTYAFNEIFCEPKPAQSPLPVWFSGVLHARNRRRIIELGDGWIPIMGATVDDVRDGVAMLRAGLQEAGRDPSTLRVQGTPAAVRGERGADLAGTMANVPALLEAGATDINTNLRLLGADPVDAAARLPELVAAFRAAVA